MLREQWLASVRLELEVVAAQIQSLSEGIKKLEREICELGRRLEGHDCLTSIKGIGDYSAAVLLSIIGDVSHFADENKLASYFGIVQKVADSNCCVDCAVSAMRASRFLLQRYATSDDQKKL